MKEIERERERERKREREREKERERDLIFETGVNTMAYNSKRFYSETRVTHGDYVSPIFSCLLS